MENSIQILNNCSLNGSETYFNDSEFGSVCNKHFEKFFFGLINPEKWFYPLFSALYGAPCLECQTVAFGQ